MDAISAKMLTCTESGTVKELHFFFQLHLESTMCTKGLEEFAHSESAKKGDLTQCDYYRGTSLLSVPSKILCKVLIDRVKISV